MSRNVRRKLTLRVLCVRGARRVNLTHIHVARMHVMNDAGEIPEGIHPQRNSCRVLVDVWETDVWEFQAKSGRFLPSFLHFLGKIAAQEVSGKTPRSPRYPSSRHRGLLIITFMTIKASSR